MSSLDFSPGGVPLIAHGAALGAYVRLISPAEYKKLSGGRLALVKYPVSDLQQEVDCRWCLRPPRPETAVEGGPMGSIKDGKLIGPDREAPTLEYLPIPFSESMCCSVQELECALRYVDRLGTASGIVNLLAKTKPRPGCLELALTLSLNPIVVDFWDASIHAPRCDDAWSKALKMITQPRESISVPAVYLTVRELPGVPLLTQEGQQPPVPWKKIGRRGYDWLHVYLPETSDERFAHQARVMRGAARLLEAEEAELKARTTPSK